MIGNPTSPAIDDATLAGLVACPSCDTLHRLTDIAPGQRARCVRCHMVLMAPREGALMRIVTLSLTAAILMVAAISFPFLSLEVMGLSRQTSVIDTIGAFSHGLMLPLALAVAGLIVILPVVRLGAILYALAPLAFGRAPFAGATGAFRLAGVLKPWAMAEVFVVGVAVALVKVAGLAYLGIGPAFWAFVGLVLVTVTSDYSMCRLTIWQSFEARR